MGGGGRGILKPGEPGDPVRQEGPARGTQSQSLQGLHPDRGHSANLGSTEWAKKESGMAVMREVLSLDASFGTKLLCLPLVSPPR